MVTWDGNDRIDIIDFGMLLYQYNLPLVPVDDYCGTDIADLFAWTGFPDADINSDGIVDLNDFSFIANNYLMISKDSCCPDTLAGSNVPMTSVSCCSARADGSGVTWRLPTATRTASLTLRTWSAS